MKGNTEKIRVFDVNTWVEKYLGNMRSRGRLVFFPLGCVCVHVHLRGLLITSFGHAETEILDTQTAVSHRSVVRWIPSQSLLSLQTCFLPEL